MKWRNKIFWLISIVFLNTEISLADDNPTISQCEEEMIKAMNVIDYKFEENYEDFLNIPDVSAVAKSTNGNIGSYINTYRCHLDTICISISNAIYQKSEQKIVFPLNQCKVEVEGKTNTSGKDFFNSLGADLSKCESIGDTKKASTILQNCKNITNLKYNFGEDYIQKEFIKTNALENNSFFSLKLLDINKKLDVLIEKVQTFVINFKKVNDDISCVNPDSTGNQ